MCRRLALGRPLRWLWVLIAEKNPTLREQSEVLFGVEASPKMRSPANARVRDGRPWRQVESQGEREEEQLDMWAGELNLARRVHHVTAS